MGITAFKEGLLVLLIVPLCAASLCQFGKEWWSEEEGACLKCSRCEQPDRQLVVLRPCQVHRDTICGPLSSLPIDWPWTRKRTHHQHQHKHQQDDETVTLPAPEHHHRPRSHAHEHEHEKQHQHHRNEFNDPPKKHKKHRPLPPLPHHEHNEDDWPVESLADVDVWEHWLQQRLQHKKEDLLKSLLLEKQRNKLSHTFDDEDDDTPSNEEDESTTHRQHQVSQLDLEIFEKLVNHERMQNRNRVSDEEPSTVSEMVVTRRLQEPFSAAETFVWDWQAIALISAVVACLLFFVLAAIYSLLHVRQWRRLKDDLHLDVEDLAVRVSLMNNGGLSSPNSDGGNTNHYLEQLLAVKKEGENMSNVYVEKQPKAS